MFQLCKIILSFILIISVILPLSLAGCTVKTANPLADGETLVQVSTIDAILNGLYEGMTDFKTLQTYGDFGIGTFVGLDGEMISLDGRFYQVKADGIAYEYRIRKLLPR